MTGSSVYSFPVISISTTEGSVVNLHCRCSGIKVRTNSALHPPYLKHLVPIQKKFTKTISKLLKEYSIKFKATVKFISTCKYPYYCELEVDSDLLSGILYLPVTSWYSEQWFVEVLSNIQKNSTATYCYSCLRYREYLNSIIPSSIPLVKDPSIKESLQTILNRVEVCSGRLGLNPIWD